MPNKPKSSKSRVLKSKVETEFLVQAGFTKPGKSKVIRSSKDFLRVYMPKFAEKYLITMRVSKEERDLIITRRGGYKSIEVSKAARP